LCQYSCLSGTSSFSRWSTDGMGNRNSKVAQQMGNWIPTKRWDYSSRLQIHVYWPWKTLILANGRIRHQLVIRIYIYFLLSFTKCLQIVHGCTTCRDNYNKFHHTWLILAKIWNALFILAFLIILNALESIDFKSQHVNVVFKRPFGLYIAHKSYEIKKAYYNLYMFMYFV